MSFKELLKCTTPCADYSKYETYYEGKSRLNALGVTLPPQMRVLEQMAPFPKLAVDVLTEVLVPEGFILGDNTEIPDMLQHWWAVNDMSTQFQLAATEALVQGAAYWIVGPGKEGIPRVSFVTRNGTATRLDHFGNVAEAVTVYTIDDTVYATHYEAGRTTYYQKSKYGSDIWDVVDSYATGLDAPAIVPMFNRERAGDVRGRSIIKEIITPTDAASRTLTNLQVAQEMLSMPQRYILGDGVAEAASAIAEERGIPLQQAKFEQYIGNLMHGPEGATVGQLPGADLSSLHNTYRMYAQEVSAITGIPPAMLGITTDNPASAEAMRVAKDRLIQRAEEKTRMFGDSIEQVFRLALRAEGHEIDGVDALELRWRDPATASESARAAYLLQAHAQGIISAETARDGLRLTPQQQARERELSENTYRFTQQLGA